MLRRGSHACREGRLRLAFARAERGGRHGGSVAELGKPRAREACRRLRNATLHRKTTVLMFSVLTLLLLLSTIIITIIIIVIIIIIIIC